MENFNAIDKIPLEIKNEKWDIPTLEELSIIKTENGLNDIYDGNETSANGS